MKNTGLIVQLIRHMIKELVAEGNLKIAAQLLLELAEKFDPDKTDEVILLLYNINNLEAKQRQGIEYTKTEQEEKNQLVARMLLITNETGRLTTKSIIPILY